MKGKDFDLLHATWEQHKKICKRCRNKNVCAQGLIIRDAMLRAVRIALALEN